MAERIYDIQSFNGGESDDFYKGPANSFYSGENIDIRKNLAGIQLESALVDTGWTFDDNITFMTNLETLGVSGGGIVVCLENGKVYLNGTLKQTLNTGTTAWNRIYGIGVNEASGTQYVYFITGSSSGSGKIHRSTTNLTTWDVSYRAYSAASGNPGYVGVINNAGLLYIAVNNKVFILTDGEVVDEYLELPSRESIKFFSQYLDKYRIYTNYETTGVQYLWDGASTAVDARQEWINQPILGGVNDGAYDYLTLGFNENYADLYLVSGTQKQELRVNLEANAKSRVLGTYLSIREGIVYISGGKTGESDNYGIYTYGNYYPGTPKSLVQSYSGTTSPFRQHCHSTANSYFACADDKVYKVEYNNPPTNLGYASSGYVVTQFYQGNIWEDKEFLKQKIGFKLNGGQIDIYARTDMSSSFSLIKSITNASYSSTKRCRLDKNELATALGTFNEIQFKFVLTRGETISTTPILYRPTTWFKTNDNI